MAGEQLHDTSEERENDTRRDDVLEQGFESMGRDFTRGQDRNDILFHEYLADRQRARVRDDELFGDRVADARRARISETDRDSLRFRDSSLHSTAVGSIEDDVATIARAEGEEVVEHEEADEATK